MINQDDIFILTVLSKGRSEIRNILYPDTCTFSYSEDEDSTVYPEVAFLRLVSKVLQSTDLDDSENELLVNELSWVVNTVLDIYNTSGFYFGLDYTEYNYFWEIMRRYSLSLLTSCNICEIELSNSFFRDMLIKYGFDILKVSSKTLGEYLYKSGNKL